MISWKSLFPLWILPLLILYLCVLFSVSQGENQITLFREDFKDLSNWEPHYFPKIERHSTYGVVEDGETSCLRATSDRSASALVLKKSFPVYDYPYMRWRWKVENTYEKGNAKSKEGDDYPIRIYLLFKKSILGVVSYPHSCLNYIWSNRAHDEDFLTSTYTEKSIMIPLQEGKARAGTWVTEEVNIIADYRETFGKDPPSYATIAIMNDSDNTRESSTSYVDFIEIFKR